MRREREREKDRIMNLRTTVLGRLSAHVICERKVLFQLFTGKEERERESECVCVRVPSLLVTQLQMKKRRKRIKKEEELFDKSQNTNFG